VADNLALAVVDLQSDSLGSFFQKYKVLETCCCVVSYCDAIQIGEDELRLQRFKQLLYHQAEVEGTQRVSLLCAFLGQQHEVDKLKV